MDLLIVLKIRNRILIQFFNMKENNSKLLFLAPNKDGSFNYSLFDNRKTIVKYFRSTLIKKIQQNPNF